MTDTLALSLKATNKKLFFPYLTFGYPDVPTFMELIKICREEGADAVEIGIPHSDPVADGPILQEASYHALKNGVTPKMIVEEFAKIKPGIPLIAMTYGNIVYRYGIERFGRDYQQVGFQGLIVADFPLEANDLLKPAAESLSIIILASTNTSSERLELIGKRSRGFVYIVSGKGITGDTRIEVAQLKQVIASLRDFTQLPLLIGFGIHSPEMAMELGELADGVIIGSTIVGFIAQHHYEPNWLSKFSLFISRYRQALDQISEQ